jgi:hypothetical protein
MTHTQKKKFKKKLKNMTRGNDNGTLPNLTHNYGNELVNYEP